MSELNNISLTKILSDLKDLSTQDKTIKLLKNNTFKSEEIKGLILFLEVNNWNLSLLNQFMDKGKDRAELIFNKKPQQSLHKQWLKYAAILIPLAFVSYYFLMENNSSNNQTIYANYYLKEAGLPVTMSIESNKMFQEAMMAYKDNSYKEAKGGFIQLQKIVNNDTLNYYIGVCELELENSTSAINHFNKVPANSFFYDKTQYRMVLCFVRLNNLMAAKNILNNSSNWADNQLKSKANKLLNEPIFE